MKEQFQPQMGRSTHLDVAKRCETILVFRNSVPTTDGAFHSFRPYRELPGCRVMMVPTTDGAFHSFRQLPRYAA